METSYKERVTLLWRKYFNGAELPITFYYTNEEGHADMAKPGSVHRCVIAELLKVRNGASLCFGADSVGCFGAKRYFGFAEGIMPDFEYFLSCGIPGKIEGERYKKSPELVKESMQHSPAFKAPGRYIVFKRWDMLATPDDPQVVICFAEPDILAGLFTLASFDEADPNCAIAPFGSGCSTIVYYPYLQNESSRPKGVIGMFDISARPFVQKNMLTFSVPMNKFIGMIENMEESFLITDSWAKVRKRINKVEH